MKRLFCASNPMRCFERLLTNIEDDRKRHSEHLKRAQQYIRQSFPDTEIGKTVSLISPAYNKYYLDNIENEYVPPRLSATSQITMPLIETIVDEAARTKDPHANLRKLRRQLAWRLHPDRRSNHYSDVLLAQANARIDRALEQTKT